MVFNFLLNVKPGALCTNQIATVDVCLMGTC